MNSNGFLVGAALWAVLAAAGPIRAAEDKKPQAPPGIFGLYIENDLAAGTDRYYTNGLKVLWVSPELGDGEGQLRAPGWIDFLTRRLPLLQTQSARRFFSLSLAQAIFFAPSPIHPTVPTPDFSMPGWPSIAWTPTAWTRPKSTSAS